MKNIYIILILTISYNFSFCQELNEKYIKTSEYIENKKRRDLFYDSDLKLIKEIYYSFNHQKIVNIINYSSDGKILRFQGFENYPKTYIDIDYVKGIYNDPTVDISLKFDNQFEFNGIQKSKKIIVNYTNNKRNGRLVQTDSAVIGSKTVLNKKADIKILLKFNILKFYNEVGLEDNYKLFKGLILNFNNGNLDGEQKGFYVNGKVKLNSTFNLSKVKSYNTFDKYGAIQTKIITDSNCVVKTPFILNGVLNENETNFYFKNDELNSVGLIVREDDFEFYGSYGLYFSSTREIRRWITDISGVTAQGWKVNIKEDGSKDYINFFDLDKQTRIDLKSVFDKNKMKIEDDNPNIIRLLMYIPMFYIKTYDFEKNDQSDLIRVELN